MRRGIDAAARIGAGKRSNIEIRRSNAPAAGPVCPNLVPQRPDRNAKYGGGMGPVSTAPDQRFANQLAFDGGNRTAHKPANSFNFSCGEFRVTKERPRHDRGFRTEAVAQCHLLQRSPAPSGRANTHLFVGKWVARIELTRAVTQTRRAGMRSRIKESLIRLSGKSGRFPRYCGNAAHPLGLERQTPVRPSGASKMRP